MKHDMPHRINVYENQKFINELGQTSYKYVKLKDVWAAVIPQTGSLQKQQADTLLSNVTHKIIVRHSSGEDITKDMQIIFKGHRFEITYIINPFFSNETLEIFCRELID